MGHKTFGTAHGILGNVFVNPTAFSSTPDPKGFNPWISDTMAHTSPHVMSERQTPDTALDLICQSRTTSQKFIRP